MFEFRWILPSAAGQRELVLQVHARNSWFGRKVLRLDGQPLYRRSRFNGIDHTFAHPTDASRTFELRLAYGDESTGWAPRLTCDHREVLETTRTRPPTIIKAPPVVAVVVGLTYLLMLMAIVTLPSVVTILEALYGKGGRWPIPDYSPTEDIVPWVMPFGLTAGCLVGFWNMRRWGVPALGVVLVLEIAVKLILLAPVSWVAIAMQVLLWCLGAAVYRRML